MRVRLPPVAVLLFFAGLMWAVGRALPAAAMHIPAPRLLAALVALFGGALGIAGVITFHRAGTTIHPMHPERASVLVIRGVYRFTRNPMYLGLALILFGWGIVLGNVVSLALTAGFVAFLTRYQIVPEERALEATFGEEFTRYRRRVRRWL